MMASKQQQEQRPGLARRRISTHRLDPLQMPPEGNYDTVEVPGFGTNLEIVEEGKQLFQNFVAEEIERESPDVLDDVALSTPQGYKNPVWAKTGQELRLLADQFAQTKERQRVRQQANAVEINIAFEEFKDMLTELFLGNGITNERIVVLFYFCSDITIRSLQAGKDMFQRFFSWCMNFIVEKVCSWVQNQGGWNQVMRSPFNTTYKLALWASAATAILVFMGFRYWRSSS